MSLCNIQLLTPSLEPLHWFALYCGCSWVGPLLSLLKAGCYPYFSWNYGIILCNFWPILKKSSSIKPLTRNHSYLVWRVPETLVSCLFKLGRSDLFLQFQLMIFVKHIFNFSQTAAQCKTLCHYVVDFFYRTTELPDLFNIKLLPLFLMKLLVILCIFQILKSFSLKLLTEIIHISWLIKFF